MTTLRAVAALYIDPRGPYPSLPDVDCWDEQRDARLYAGPWPVVAHPPCGPWGQQRHNYQGAEHDCAPLAVEQVRRWGGVLEQPAGSKLWDRCDLPRPWGADDFGYSIEVEQLQWGHVARKRTWLYLVGVRAGLVDDGMERAYAHRRQPTHWCSGGRTRGKGSGGLVPPGIKVCSAQQRRRTPVAFAEWLIALARSATRTARTPLESRPR